MRILKALQSRSKAQEKPPKFIHDPKSIHCGANTTSCFEATLVAVTNPGATYEEGSYFQNQWVTPRLIVNTRWNYMLSTGNRQFLSKNKTLQGLSCVE